jgi:ElaB/YqjD/DUF883 family membrane-anchored ribosome-binding protein
MNTSASKEKLAADFRLVMDDIDALMKATTEKAEGEISSLRSRIRDRLDSVKDRAATAQEEALLRAKEAARVTDDYAHEHPWQLVGAAAAVGLALGMLIGRR